MLKSPQVSLGPRTLYSKRDYCVTICTTFLFVCNSWTKYVGRFGTETDTLNTDLIIIIGKTIFCKNTIDSHMKGSLLAYIKNHDNIFSLSMLIVEICSFPLYKA